MSTSFAHTAAAPPRRDAPAGPAAPPLLPRVARLAASVLGARAAALVLADGGAPHVAASFPSPLDGWIEKTALSMLARVLAGGTVATADARGGVDGLRALDGVGGLDGIRGVGGVVDAAAVDGTPVMDGLVDADAVGSADACAVLAVAVLDSAGAAVGALVVVGARGRAWTEEDARAAEDLAAAAAAGVELAARRAGERRLRDSVRTLEKAVETMQLGVTVTGVDGRIVYTNPAEAAMHGYTAAELVGRPARLFAPPERWDEQGRPPLAQVRSWSRESENVRRDGSRFPVALWSDAVAGDDGEPLGVVTCSADLTETRAREAALGRREREFQTLAENAPDVVARVDRNLRLTYVNAAAAAALGRTRDELLGAPVDDADRVPGMYPWADAVRGVLATGVERTVEAVVPSRSGLHGRVWEARLAPERDADGAVETVLTIGRDVTARHRAQAALRESEERFRQLAENVAAVFYVLQDGPERRLLYVSPTYETLTGRPADALYASGGAAWIQAVHPDDRARVQDAAAVLDGRRSEIEYRVMRPNGEVRTVCDRIFPVRGGPERRYAGIVEDVTERRAAEDALRESEARYRSVVESVHDVVFRTDRQGRWTLLNPAWEKVTGYTVAESLGRSCFDFVAADARAEQAARFEAAMVGAYEPHHRVQRFVTRDGRTRWLAGTVVVMRDPQGRAVGTQGALGDVTERHQAEEALRASEQRYRLLFESSPVAIMTADAQGRIVHVNPAAEALLGHSARSAAGLTLADITHPADVAEQARLHGELLAGARDNYSLGKRYLRGDGSVVWAQVTVSALRDADGGLLGTVGMSQDVTPLRETLAALRAAHDEMEARVGARTAELDAANAALRREVDQRARSEAALRQSEARFRAVVENVGEGLLLADADGVVLYANPQVRAVTGWEPAELEGRRLEEVLPGCAETADGAAGGKGRRQLPLTRRDGTRGWVEATAGSMRDGEGRVVGVLAAVADVTERRLADEELRAVQERLRLLVETVREYAMVVLDPDGYVVSWNAGAERNTGYPAEEILGRSGSVFYPPAELAEDRPARDLAAAAEAGHRETEGWRLRRDGSRYWANTVLTALRDGRGRLLGFAEITRDLTDRKRAEEALRRSEEQLRHSQKMEAVGRLAGGIAHDFNNILMAVGGHVQLLLRRAGAGDPARRSLEEVKKGADRAAALTRQLLAFSRRQVLHTRVLDLNQVVRDMEGMLEPLLGPDVELVMLLDDGTARVRADASQVEQVVMNLVVNARDAMPQGGVVVVETREVAVGEGHVRRHPYLKPGRFVALEVTDTGHGMDDETREQVFEPFFTTKDPGKGTGLGLSTVYGIVKQSGGYVTADSTPDVFTTFRVYLPAVDAEADGPAQGARARRARGGPETVLLVEDEPAVRALLAEVLTDAGYRVLQAVGGHEALALVGRHAGPVHLLLTDVVMPGMNGGELARRIRALHPRAAVLYMSGYAADDAVRMGMEAGAVDLLEKPVPPDEVAVRVRRALDAAGRHP